MESCWIAEGVEYPEFPDAGLAGSMAVLFMRSADNGKHVAVLNDCPSLPGPRKAVSFSSYRKPAGVTLTLLPPVDRMN